MCHLRHRYHRPSRPSQPRSPFYRTPTPGQLSLSLSAVAARPGLPLHYAITRETSAALPRPALVVVARNCRHRSLRASY